MLKLFIRLVRQAGCLARLGHDWDGGLLTFGARADVWLECGRCGQPSHGWQTKPRRPAPSLVVKRSGQPALDVTIQVDASQALDGLALLATTFDQASDPNWRGNRKVQ